MSNNETVYEDDREVVLVNKTRELTDEQLLEAGQKLAEYEEKLAVVKAEAKQVAAEYKGKVSDVEASRASLASIIRLKEEEVVYECYADPDYKTGLMVFTDVETGQIIEERKLTNEERQMKLIDMENQKGGEVNTEGFVEEPHF
jgi:hypothetical protein